MLIRPALLSDEEAILELVLRLGPQATPLLICRF